MIEGKKSILVVEDNAGILKLLSLKLKLEGFDVLEAHNGQEALDLLTSKRPVLLLLDLLLPVLNGFEVLKKLRELPEIPVIAFSAYKELESKALELGANMFISKPFDPDTVVRKTRELLAK